MFPLPIDPHVPPPHLTPSRSSRGGLADLGTDALKLMQVGEGKTLEHFHTKIQVTRQGTGAHYGDKYPFIWQALPESPPRETLEVAECKSRAATRPACDLEVPLSQSDRPTLDNGDE